MSAPAAFGPRCRPFLRYWGFRSMSQAQTPYHTPDDEVLLSNRDLSVMRFEGQSVETARIEGKLWLREWDIIDALDRPCDEAPALFARLTKHDCRLVVLGRGESAEEQGCFVSIRGAMAMTVACPDVVIPGSAANGSSSFSLASPPSRSGEGARMRPRWSGATAISESSRAGRPDSFTRRDALLTVDQPVSHRSSPRQSRGLSYRQWVLRTFLFLL